MPKKHHTKRLLNARRKAIKKWEKGLTCRGLPVPTKEQYEAFVTAYNMGYTSGRKHVLFPNKQQSKWKPILNELFRFNDPISFDRAVELLGCTEKALHKHIDNFVYFPTNEDMHYSYEYDYKIISRGMDIERETSEFITRKYNKDINCDNCFEYKTRGLSACYEGCNNRSYTLLKQHIKEDLDKLRF